MAQAGNRQGVIDAFLEETADVAPGSMADELLRCLLQVRAVFKGWSGQSKAGLSALIEALAEASQKKGVQAAGFYPYLLEKILLDEAPSPVPRRSAKERILDAALEVFSHKGFHPATMDEIAERAGVGKGTLYRYFATKEKLFGELVRLRLEELGNRAGAVIDGSDDVLTMISKYIRLYFEFFDRNQRLYRLIVQEQLDLGDHSPNEYFGRVLKAIPNLKRKVYEGTQQGILKDVDFRTVFYGTMGFAHGVIEKWLSQDCSYSLVDELPGVLEVLFHGFVRNDRKTDEN